ncbi:glycerol-3-phosphate 1-O-acyltransferase PlsY [Yoonia sp.]|uniref:glycerol-3-phosphate 1-O-acyltransferase PlsY n=1 Tax=Yoonia sp. TaxID=2212373 RepID=UPI002FDAFBA0
MPMIENLSVALGLAAVFGYLLGSVSGGMIMARMMNLGNLREIGSGNIGATNVLRTGNKKAAALTLVFDAAKGAIAVLLARVLFSEEAAQIAGLAAFFGHCFPVWLGFKGGKGVATYFGVIWALAWPMGAAASLIWLLIAILTRYSSLAALVAAGWVPVVMSFTGYGDLFLLGIVMALLLYVRHWGNVRRLRAGTEPKIGAKPVAKS